MLNCPESFPSPLPSRSKPETPSTSSALPPSSAAAVVGVIHVNGVINRTSSLLFERKLESTEDTNLSCMVLFLDSNGGSPAEVSIMIGLPDNRGNQGQIPVLAFVRGQAESAGYQITASATSIYVTRFSSLGSIGVNCDPPQGGVAPECCSGVELEAQVQNPWLRAPDC